MNRRHHSLSLLAERFGFRGGAFISEDVTLARRPVAALLHLK